MRRLEAARRSLDAARTLLASAHRELDATRRRLATQRSRSRRLMQWFALDHRSSRADQGSISGARRSSRASAGSFTTLAMSTRRGPAASTCARPSTSFGAQSSQRAARPAHEAIARLCSGLARDSGCVGACSRAASAGSKRGCAVRDRESADFEPPTYMPPPNAKCWRTFCPRQRSPFA